MRDKAIIADITDKNIVVIPLITNACLSCAEGCAKRGKPFSVSNPKNFTIKKGSIVKIAAGGKIQIIQGFFSLIFPTLCAVAGYFLANPIAAFFHRKATEGLHAGCTLLFLALSSLAVFFISRNYHKIIKAEITETCE